MAQSDTAQVLPTFVYRDSIRETYNPFTTNAESIENSPSFQLHDVLQKMPGVNIRNYGGYGGIKTYSARGLGAQHSGVIVNGVSQPLAFGGVVDLSRIALENVSSIDLGQNVSREKPQTALSFRSANTLFLESKNNSFSNKKFRNQIGFEVGSFDHYRGGIEGHYQWSEKYQIGWMGKYVNVRGDYPYQYQLGDIEMGNYRKHAQMDVMQFQLTQLIQLKPNQSLTLEAGYFGRNQELPGAIVLYQDGISRQNLGVQDGHYRLDYLWKKSKLKGRVLVSGKHSLTHYSDSSFLNQDGFLTQRYKHHLVHVSTPLQWQLQSFTLYTAIDYRWQMLSGVTNSDTTISRNEIPIVLGAKWQKKGWYADASLLAQWIENGQNWMNGWNPSLKVGKKWGWLGLQLMYKNSLRLPTFYEQYYGKYTATSIQPEKAHQMDVTVSSDYAFSVPIFPRIIFGTRFMLNGFYNIVKDKIITYPTQDLFIWAIENYGKVHSYGGSFSGQLSMKMTDFKVVLDGSYTLQYAIDKTDSESLEYNNQVPYTPHNLVNLGMQVQWKGLFLSVNYHFNGFRYAWKENAWNTVLDDFYTLDASLGYQIQFKNKHKLRLKVTGMNLTNQQYEVIRSYPMPGANMKIGLQYEIF